MLSQRVKPAVVINVYLGQMRHETSHGTTSGLSAPFDPRLFQQAVAKCLIDQEYLRCGGSAW